MGIKGDASVRASCIQSSLPASFTKTSTLNAQSQGGPTQTGEAASMGFSPSSQGAGRASQTASPSRVSPGWRTVAAWLTKHRIG